MCILETSACQWIYQSQQQGKTHNRDAKYPKELKAAQVKKTDIHMQVNAVFFQSEFGIIAGFPRRSCQPTQATKTGSKATPRLRMMIFEVSFMFEVLPVNTLQTISDAKSSN